MILKQSDSPQKNEKCNTNTFQKLQAKELQSNFQWLLTSPNFQAMSNSCLGSGKLIQTFQNQIADIEGEIHVQEGLAITLSEVKITQGILIHNNYRYVILGDCVIQKQQLRSFNDNAYVINIKNSRGVIKLIFIHPISRKLWYNSLKRYSQLEQFNKKYDIIQHQMDNYYLAVNKAKKTQFTVQLFKKKDILYKEQLDTIRIYMQILRSLDHKNILKIEKSFEDKQKLYIVHKQIKGFTLRDMIRLVTANMYKVTELQIASIIYQSLQALKTLEGQQLFHGHISIDNLIINTDKNSEGSVYLVNMHCKSYTPDSLESYLMSLPDYLIAPEILSSNKCPSISTDIYQLGICFYLISFSGSNSLLDLNNIEDLIENKDVYLKQQLEYFQNNESMALPDSNLVFRFNQLNLIMQMIDPDPNMRITLKDAAQHQWLQEVNGKTNSQPQKVLLQLSLKTIIETIEYSDNEIAIQSYQQFSQKKISKLKLSQQHSIALHPIIFSDTAITICDEDDDTSLSQQVQQLHTEQFQMIPSKNYHLQVNAGML